MRRREPIEIPSEVIAPRSEAIRLLAVRARGAHEDVAVGLAHELRDERLPELGHAGRMPRVDARSAEGVVACAGVSCVACHLVGPHRLRGAIEGQRRSWIREIGREMGRGGGRLRACMIW